MVVMGAEDHHLVLELRITPRQQAEDVGRLHPVDVIGELEGGGDAEGDGLEVAGFRLVDQLGEVLAGRLEEAPGGVLGGPARHLDARLATGGELELLAAPGGLHHLPRIAGRGCRVNDDRSRRPLSRRALVLVGPAAVVETAVAFEQLGVPVRIVVHHHQDLALEVRPLEIVPLVFGGLDAVAHEHQLGVPDRGGGLLDLARGDVLVRPFELDGLVAGFEVPGLGGVGFDAHHVEGLLPGAALGARLVAEELEGGGEIEAGRLVAAAGDAAALQQVVREEAQGRLQGATVDGLGRLVGARGEEEARRRCLRSGLSRAGEHRRQREEEGAGEDLRPGLSFRVLHER